MCLLMYVMWLATGQEKASLAEAESLKQLPPHNHLVNFLLNMSSKGMHVRTHTEVHIHMHAHTHYVLCIVYF